MLEPWIPDPRPPDGDAPGPSPEWIAELQAKEQATEYHWWN